MDVTHFPPFRPHPLLGNGHAQTIFACYARPARSEYRAERRDVRLPDGDTIVLHDDRPPAWCEGNRVVLLVPGLCGSHQSPFMPRIAMKLNAAGFRTFRMDLRGFGAGFGLAQLPGHAGRSEDVAAAIRSIATMSPSSPLTVVGFSMGGNIVLKLLGEVGHDPLGGLDSGLAVAPPIDLQRCSVHIQLPWNRLYARTLVKALLRHVRRQRPFVAALEAFSDQPRPKTLLQFDDRFTAPLSGFADAEEYYRQSSAGPLLQKISLPALVITAADDPMVPPAIFDEHPSSPATSLLVTDRGGHLGYVGASGVDQDNRWLDWRIVDWIAWQDNQCDRVHQT